MVFSFEYKNKGIFSLTIPKVVLSFTDQVDVGDHVQFSFVQSLAAAENSAANFKHMPKSVLNVTKSEDGSLHITNEKDGPSLTGGKKLQVLIVEADNDHVDTNEDDIHVGEDSDIVPEETAESEIDVSLRVVKQETEVNQVVDHDYSGIAEVSDCNEENFPEIVAESLPLKRKTPARPKQYNTDISTCSLCAAKLKGNWNLFKHTKKVHSSHDSYKEIIDDLQEQIKVICQKCHKVFANPKVYQEHEQKVHQEFQGMACEFCDKKYRTEHHLRVHVKYAHHRPQKKNIQCPHCDKRFNRRNVLKEHIRYCHTDHERIYQCTKCHFKYAFQKQFYEHFNRVHGPKKHACTSCGYKSATLWYLKKHQKHCRGTTHQKHCQGTAQRYNSIVLKEESESSSIEQIALNPQNVLTSIPIITESVDKEMVDQSSVKYEAIHYEAEGTVEVPQDTYHYETIMMPVDNEQDVGTVVANVATEREEEVLANGNMQTITVMMV